MEIFWFIFRKGGLLASHRLLLKILYAGYALALIALALSARGTDR